MKRWRLGALLGFPIYVGLGFLLLLGFVAIWRGGLVGVGLVLLAFASVLLHELGHAVVARRLGVPVESIELGFFGGAAKMVALPKSATHEIAIAAAGPAVSVVLAALGLAVGALTGVELIELIGWINVVIAAFNLIPALPMDGGRILRALLTWKWSYVRATDLAVMLSRGFAVLLVVAAVAWGPWTLALMAVFLWMLGTRERAIARMVASQYRTGAGGYVERRWDDPVVMPRGAYPGPARPASVVSAPASAPSPEMQVAAAPGRAASPSGRSAAASSSSCIGSGGARVTSAARRSRPPGRRCSARFRSW